MLQLHRTASENDGIIEIANGPRYLATAKILSDYISTLPLTVEQNDKLVELIRAHSHAGRLEAYSQALAPLIGADTETTP